MVAQAGMPPQLRLNAVAFVSPQNHPILIRTFSQPRQDELKYHYIAHTSLDVIEERSTRKSHSLCPRDWLTAGDLCSCCGKCVQVDRLLPGPAVRGRRRSVRLHDAAESEDHHRARALGRRRA